MGCGSSNTSSLAKSKDRAAPTANNITVPSTTNSQKLQPDHKSSSPEEFASEHVNIQIDENKDENLIASTEDNYPQPTPSKYSGEIIRPKDQWFEDKDFEISSDDADALESAKVEDDTDVNVLKRETAKDCIDIGDVTKDVTIPNGKPSTVKKSKINFEDVDTHAKHAHSSLANSFEDLMNYLSKPLEGDRHREIKLARAIVVWMSQQKLEVNRGTASVESPNGLLQYLKERRMTYTSCYALLCRKAGLSCTIVKGYVKAAEYEPGDEIMPPEAAWNAVYMEGGWLLVHPYWVCRALYGHKLGGWIKIEVDGKPALQTEQRSHGIVKSTFQEHYFMPKPEEFIYTCYAKDTCWQLVKKSLEVHTMTQFLEMPYLLPPFFGLGFELISEHKCVLDSKDGFCKIEFKTNHPNAHMIVLSYELFQKSSDKFKKEKDMSRMVFNSRAGANFIFKIRFPCEGTYKLVIYGGPYKSPALRLCEFKLVCTKRMTGYDLLPPTRSDIGWGPGPVTFEAGLLLPSRPNGLIPVNKQDKTTALTFLISENYCKNHEYSANLHTEIDGKRKKFADNVKAIMDTSQEKQLMITAVLPTEGEYGLEILHSSDEVRDETICNYLLSTKAYKPQKANVTNAKDKLRAQIEKYVAGEDLKKHVESLTDCIMKCKNEKISNSDDDMIVATSRLKFLHYKNLLRDCELRRRLDLTQRALKAIERYTNKGALITQIKRVEQLEKELLALNGYGREVPMLETALQEIVAINSAIDPVFVIFKALLVLLMGPENQFHEWVDIRSQLRLGLSTDFQLHSILDKMKQISEQSVTAQQKKIVHNLLEKYSEDYVRKSNSAAHSFYVWIQRLLETNGV